MPMESAAMATCALRVSLSCACASSPSLLTSAAMSRSNTSDAHSSAACTSGTPKSETPMPGFCDPCPEAMKTVWTGPIPSS